MRETSNIQQGKDKRKKNITVTNEWCSSKFVNPG